MSNPITRRTALAGAGALPLLPVSAHAGANVKLALHLDDPAVKAYEEWRAAFAHHLETLDLYHDWENSPEVAAGNKAETEAANRLADTVPTTLAGLVAQLAFAHYAFGEVERDGDWFNLADYRFGTFTDDRDGRVLRSMTAGAENMAGAL